MNNNQKGSAHTPLIILVFILAVAVIYFAVIKKPAQTTTVQPTNTPLSQTSPIPPQHDPIVKGQQVQTTIYVPKDQGVYDQKVQNARDSGINPSIASLTDADFKAEKVIVTTTPSYGIEQASADAAAATVQSQADIKTIGFKVVGSTAYVVLNINADGWAGVTTSIDAVTPIVQKTLLQFPDIKNVEIGSLKAFKITGVPTP